MYIWGGVGGKAPVLIHSPRVLIPCKPTQTRESLVWVGSYHKLWVFVASTLPGRKPTNTLGKGKEDNAKGSRSCKGQFNVYLGGCWWHSPCPYTFPACRDIPDCWRVPENPSPDAAHTLPILCPVLARSCLRDRAQLIYIWGRLGTNPPVLIHSPLHVTPDTCASGRATNSF